MRLKFRPVDPNESPWTLHRLVEVADYLQVCETTVRQLVRDGKLHVVNVCAGSQTYGRVPTGSVLRLLGILPDWQPVPEYTGPKLVERAG